MRKITNTMSSTVLHFLWCLDIQQNPQQIRQLGLYKSLEVLNLSAWMNTGFVIFTNVADSIAQSLYKNCVLTILRV